MCPAGGRSSSVPRTCHAGGAQPRGLSLFGLGVLVTGNSSSFHSRLFTVWSRSDMRSMSSRICTPLLHIAEEKGSSPSVPCSSACAHTPPAPSDHGAARWLISAVRSRALLPAQMYNMCMCIMIYEQGPQPDPLLQGSLPLLDVVLRALKLCMLCSSSPPITLSPDTVVRPPSRARANGQFLQATTAKINPSCASP